jgi:hypothetical protein
MTVQVAPFERESPIPIPRTAFRFSIGAHNEMLSVVMRVNNPDRLPLAIESLHPAQASSSFAQIVGYDLPVPWSN